MTNISKQFADLATALRSDLFLKTRLKVAFFYWISILLVVVLFSFLLFFTTRENLQEDTGQTDGANEIENQIEEQVVSKTLNTLLSTIYITDIVILLVAASLSYYVTARTLRPVRDAAEQQNQFISDAAHELRTPLSILKIGFDVLNASPTKSLVAVSYTHLTLPTTERV